MIDFTPLQKLPKNVGYLGKLIVAKGFKKLPKVQQIAQSGHTGYKILSYKIQADTNINKVGRLVTTDFDKINFHDF